MTSLQPFTKVTAPAVGADLQRRTCLVVDREGSIIKFIPLSIESGFNVEQMPEREFVGVYQHLSEYPAERCAALFAQYAMTVGGSQEAMDYLGQFTKLSTKEIDMATAKKSAAAAKTAKPTADKAAKAKPAAKTKATKEVADKPPKAPGEKRESAAQMFKDLIMAGNFTDAKIFEKVQAKYGLDDNKASYVGWYRKDLIKKGMNPPPAKG